MRKFPFLCLLFFLAGCGNAQVKEATTHSLQSPALTTHQPDLIFDKAKVFPEATQLAVAIIRNGKLSFAGTIRQGDSLVLVDNRQSAFEIGSITKVFTSTLLAHAVVSKGLVVHESINKYLPFALKDDTPITFEQLANHTSGLPRMPSNFQLSAFMNPGNPYKNYTEEKLKEYLTKEMRLEHNPGQESSYSNLGAGLLGYTITKYNGKDFETLLRDQVFSPLGMAHTTTLREQLSATLIKGLSETGKEVSNWDLSALAGAGGILSTAEDMSKFALAQFDTSNLALALTQKETFRINDKMGVGLGWHLLYDSPEATWLWHNGGTGGYTSSMALDIERKNGVILLSNVSAFSRHMKNIDELCFALMRTLATP